MLEDLDRFAHFEDADHVAVVDIAVIAERDAEVETRIHPVGVHFAEVVIHATGTEHRTGDASTDGERGREFPDALRAGHDDLVAGEERLEFVEEGAVAVGEFLRAREPVGGGIDAATTEALVVAHHAGAGEGFEEVEDVFAFAERIHERRAGAAAVLHEEAGEAGVIQEARELGQDNADVFGALGDGLAGEFLDGKGVGPVVRHRREVIEPVGVGHRPEIGDGFAEFLVVAVEVTEDGFELHDGLTVEGDDHAEHAVSGRVVRAHGDLEEVAVETVVDLAHVGAARLRRE